MRRVDSPENHPNSKVDFEHIPSLMNLEIGKVGALIKTYSQTKHITLRPFSERGLPSSKNENWFCTFQFYLDFYLTLLFGQPEVHRNLVMAIHSSWAMGEPVNGSGVIFPCPGLREWQLWKHNWSWSWIPIGMANACRLFLTNLNDFWGLSSFNHPNSFKPKQLSLSQWTLKKKVWTLFSLLNIRHPKKFKPFSHWPSKNCWFIREWFQEFKPTS